MSLGLCKTETTQTYYNPESKSYLNQLIMRKTILMDYLSLNFCCVYAKIKISHLE